jgi:hypothetical protein
MLPDFTSLKAELSKFLIEFVRLRMQVHFGPLAKIPRQNFPEGDASAIERAASGEVEETQFMPAHAELQVKMAEIPSLTLQEVLQRMDKMAESLAGQMAEAFYRSMSETLDRAGQSISAQGRPLSAEHILEMLTKIQIDFDQSGTPRLPEIHIHPRMQEAADKAMRELQTNAELGRQWEALIVQKKEEWRAREASRRLVG